MGWKETLRIWDRAPLRSMSDRLGTWQVPAHARRRLHNAFLDVERVCDHDAGQWSVCTALTVSIITWNKLREMNSKSYIIDWLAKRGPINWDNESWCLGSTKSFPPFSQNLMDSACSRTNKTSFHPTLWNGFKLGTTWSFVLPREHDFLLFCNSSRSVRAQPNKSLLLQRLEIGYCNRIEHLLIGGGRATENLEERSRKKKQKKNTPPRMLAAFTNAENADVIRR